jgi:hypothetical protein
MKITLALTLLSSLFLFACNSENTAKEKESYNATKKSLLLKEEKNPAAFIIVKGNSRKNIVGQTVVRGSLTNKASVATYKDVNLQLSFYSKTKALLETDKETIYQILNPGESNDFKTKYFAPKGTDSVGLKVLSAKVIQQPANQ